jgi:phosphonate transport system substrate-binding protein
MGLNKIVLSIFLLVSIVWVAVAAQDDDCMKFGVVPYKSPREVVKLYSPIASILAKTLGRNVRVVTADDFEQYMQRVYDKKYDIILLGSTFYFKAHDRAGYQAVARGFPSFRCGIIVRSGSGIHDIGQLRGKSMAAVDSKDRGGYKLQKMALLKRGIDVDSDLDVHFRGKHDSVICAVLNGQDDAGAIRLDALQKATFAGVRKRIKIIYTSPENPQFPFAVRQDLEPLLRDQISGALVSITGKEPASAAILQRLNIQGIERITNSDLELLRQARKKEEQP